MRDPFDKSLEAIVNSPDVVDLPRIVAPGRKHLELPFRPFTLDEVKAITGCRTDILELWAERLGYRRGCGVEGLEYAQVFGVFVGWRFLEEGAPAWRATEACEYVSLVPDSYLTEQLKEGNTFVVTRGCFPKDSGIRAGMLVRAPDNRLGKTLNLKRLLEEFDHRMKKVFPNV
jgi:hypothetical protein